LSPCFLHSYADLRYLHSFPTRRSSDLISPAAHCTQNWETGGRGACTPRICNIACKPMRVRSRDANLSRWSIASGDMMVSIDGFLIEECRDLTRIIPFPDTSVRASTSPIANWRKSLFRTSAVDDRKSTRLNSSHDQISYAVFCLKKKIQIPASTTSLERG